MFLYDIEQYRHVLPDVFEATRCRNFHLSTRMHWRWTGTMRMRRVGEYLIANFRWISGCPKPWLIGVDIPNQPLATMATINLVYMTSVAQLAPWLISLGILGTGKALKIRGALTSWHTRRVPWQRWHEAAGSWENPEDTSWDFLDQAVSENVLYTPSHSNLRLGKLWWSNMKFEICGHLIFRSLILMGFNTHFNPFFWLVFTCVLVFWVVVLILE